VKFTLLIVFFLLNSLVYYITEKNLDQRTEATLDTHIHKLEVHYQIFLTTQAMNADIMYEAIVNRKEVLEVLKEAYKTELQEDRNKLRTKLEKILLEKYNTIKEGGVLQLHFVDSNNTSFLRMHKSSKFNDSLEDVRLDFAKVNTEHKVVRGFSQGRTAHAFRNIYPIFDKQKNYLGAVEISYPSEILQNNLNNVSDIYSHFLVSKEIFKIKSWNRDDLVLSYAPSYVNKNYMLTNTHIDNGFSKKLHINERLDLLRSEIDKKLKQKKEFSLVSDLNNNVVVISFIPIYQNLTKEVSAWIVSYESDSFLTIALRDSFIVRVLSFFIISIIMFSIYRIMTQKKRLNEIVSLYDKNVVFSSTDTEGVITHVSDAFCEISGFSKDDLIGKSHSILRHSDMKDEFFEELWDTITKGETWQGEIKSIKKSGGYFWADAEIEQIVKENKVIGYSSIRHDITDRKELDTIQKDIIFTMGAIGENRSAETGNHVQRVALYSKLFAEHYGLPREKVEALHQASPMHDIGKIAIPDAILNKPGRLNEEEMKIMKTHAQKGYDMLCVSNRPLLQAAAVIAHHHHEKWDGSGYPNGLMKDEIDIFGRITAIADVFDALGSERCYKKAWPDEKIFALLRAESGKHFEPRLVEIFFEHLDEFLKIRDSLK